MDRILFPLNVFGREQRRDKLLGKAVQCWFQVFRLDVEEVIGVLVGRVGVVAPAMLTDKALVFAGLRILFRAKEEHVLKEMGQSLIFRWILTTAHLDVECRRRFLGGWV